MSTAPAGSRQQEMVKSEMKPIVTMFECDHSRRRVAALVPQGVDPARLIRMALLSISKSDALRRCTPESLLLSLCDAAALGLDCGGALGQAYLVPFKGSVTLIIGYRGMIALARKSGEISNVYAYVVRRGDQFTYSLGLDPKLDHVPGGSVKDDDITHVYAVCRFKDGGFQFDVMTRADVDRIRSRSRAAESGPWVTDYAEMAKKTVLRRLCKLLPMTADAADAIEQSDRGEFGDFVAEAATGEDRPTLKDKIAGKQKQLTEPQPQQPDDDAGEMTDAEKQAVREAEAKSETPEPESDADKWERKRAAGQSGEMFPGSNANAGDPIATGGKRR